MCSINLDEKRKISDEKENLSDDPCQKTQKITKTQTHCGEHSFIPDDTEITNDVSNLNQTFKLISFFIVTVLATTFSHIYDNFLGPQIDYMTFDTETNRTRDLTYYHRSCPLGQVSTNSLDDLVIGDDFTPDECAEHMMVHGMSMYKDIIDKDTAASLRSYIIKRNKKLSHKEAIGVLENKNRWSFGIGANDHPSVGKALNEIVTNEKLRPALEKIAGRNPAVIEMTAITAGYGADDQGWHPDVVASGSPTKYTTKFAPSYALFITLQVSLSRCVDQCFNNKFVQLHNTHVL